MKNLLAAIMIWASAGAALGQSFCTGLPYTLTNGTTADASQVMANFNYLQSCATALQGGAYLLLGRNQPDKSQRHPHKCIELHFGERQ